MEYQPYALISVSLGVSSYPEDGHDAAAIVENSDKALLHAKTWEKSHTCASKNGL